MPALDDPAEARTLAEALRAAAMRLRAAGIENGRSEARLLMALAGLPRERQIAGPDEPLAPSTLGLFAGLVERRCAREPMAYIRGTAPFLDFELAVRPGVLVPRPETEVLVEAVAAEMRRRRVGRILDLGVGSGCIVLALLRLLPGSAGVGVDQSVEAIGCTADNAHRLGLDGRLELVTGDWEAAPAGPYDVIVSNPPYIAAGELDGLQPEVRDFEPRLALAGDADGLEPYRLLVPLAASLLASGGLVAFEHGAGQADAVAALLSAGGFATIQRHRDLAGIERCVTARSY